MKALIIGLSLFFTIFFSGCAVYGGGYGYNSGGYYGNGGGYFNRPYYSAPIVVPYYGFGRGWRFGGGHYYGGRYFGGHWR
jgi:hypothetical protein